MGHTTIKFPRADKAQFFKTLNRRVNEYFKENNLSKAPRKCTYYNEDSDDDFFADTRPYLAHLDSIENVSITPFGSRMQYETPNKPIRGGL